jgi:hypothetical protein
VGTVALAVLLGACGSGKPAATASESPTTTAADSTTTAANNAAATAYRDCLSQHGVTLPNFGQGGQRGNGGTPTDTAAGGGSATGSSTPADSTPPNSTPGNSTPPDSRPRGSFPGGPNGSVDPATQAALQACASLRPQGGNGFGGNGTGNRGANSQALQAYFSCLKDNGVNVPDTTAPNGPPPSIDRSSPAFAAANAKCQVLLPQRGNGSTTTTTQG